MGSNSKNRGIASALFGKTRRAVLALIYGNTEKAFYLREIARAAGSGLGAVQREVRRLSDAGILSRTARGREVYYQADPDCPIFAELKSLVIKTAGVADVLRGALSPLSDRISVAFIYGSFARGEQRPGSDVDVLLAGDATFAEVVSALGGAQETLGREINPSVYPPAEFRTKLAAGHHFLRSVMKGSRLFLIGTERELARLAEKRVAD